MIKKSLRGEDNTNTFWRHIKCGGNEKRKKEGYTNLGSGT